MLKYLFIANYKDGTSFVQNKEDVSSVDPKRSAYFDVKQDELVSFALFGEGNTYFVDLTNGCFSVNGVPFRAHKEQVTDFKLVFNRQHTHTYNGVEELSHIIVYNLGWEGVDSNNLPIERVLQIL